MGRLCDDQTLGKDRQSCVVTLCTIETPHGDLGTISVMCALHRTVHHGSCVSGKFGRLAELCFVKSREPRARDVFCHVLSCTCACTAPRSDARFSYPSFDAHRRPSRRSRVHGLVHVSGRSIVGFRACPAARYSELEAPCAT